MRSATPVLLPKSWLGIWVAQFFPSSFKILGRDEMKITSIEAIPVALPLVRTIVMASRTVDRAEVIVVIVHTDEGITGVGECQPVPKRSGETLASAKYAVESVLAPKLAGRDPFDIQPIWQAMRKALVYNLAAIAAVDIALYDLKGKALGVPVYQLLGGKFRSEVSATWHVDGSDPGQVREEALEGAGLGYSIFKPKVGIQSLEKDLLMVETVREAVGSAAQLRPDANQSWQPKDAIRFLKRAEQYDLAFLEQPVPYRNITGMAEVKAATTVPVAADEGLFDVGDVLDIHRHQAADIVSLKIMKSAGITGASRMATAAAGVFLPIHIASMMVETSICAAAGLHLAASLPELNFDCGFTNHYLKEDIVENPVIYTGGSARVPEGPGLGVALDADRLKKYALI